MSERERLLRETWAGLLDVFLGEEIHDRFHDAATTVGLPHPGALKALMFLDAGEPQPMRALAEVLRCDASYVTNLVHTLESQGYVERRTSASDRRVKHVHLTAEGERARACAREIIERPPAALDRLTDAQIRTLARLTARLEGRGADRPAPGDRP